MRSVLAVTAATGVVGVSFGAIAAAAGVTLPRAIAMSMLVFAGGAQFMAVGVVAAGGSVAAAVLAGLLLNLRHLPFGLAIGDAFGGRWSGRLIGSHLLTDEATAFTIAQPDAAGRRRAYWLTAVSLYVLWNIGTVVGVLAGQAVGDPAAFGVDAAFPAGMLALVWPSLREWAAARVALVGSLLALVTTPVLPPGLPVLVALLALVLALPVPRKILK